MHCQNDGKLAMAYNFLDQNAAGFFFLLYIRNGPFVADIDGEGRQSAPLRVLFSLLLL